MGEQHKIEKPDQIKPIFWISSIKLDILIFIYRQKKQKLTSSNQIFIEIINQNVTESNQEYIYIHVSLRISL